jgi:hypothetical protein
MGGGSLVMAFSGRLPDAWQDFGLYCGLIAVAVGVLATAFHHANLARQKQGKSPLRFETIHLVAMLLAVGLGWTGWQLYSIPRTPKAIVESAPPTTNKSILVSSRYYSAKNKEEVSGILDTVSNAINKPLNHILELTEIAINKSPWDRPGEDTAPYIKRMDDILSEISKLRYSLYDDLYKDNPDYRIELNALLYPIEPFLNFQSGAADFRVGLGSWSALNNTLDPSKREDLSRLVGATRMTFGVSRDKFLTWLSERQQLIALTRRDLAK